MLRASRTAMLSIGMLLSSAGFADDALSSKTGDSTNAIVTFSADTLAKESLYVSNWEQLQPTIAIADSDERLRPISNLHFQDSSALARARKIRALSLLTLGHFGQSRLFLGVNDDGIAGLHFNAFPRHGDDTYIELVRMPYLQEEAPDK
ncbi:MAG: hypothetical protein OER97_09055 [Gammaproteobacteria bacterium]|nr:hypothetical protein [Gammaproteobacteria bacterium]